jgi:hypothetical protein
MRSKGYTMVKKFFAISLLMASAVYGMDSEQDRTPTLQPWVEQATKVTVETALKGYMLTVPVDNETTVHDVKQGLCDSQGIALDLQNLNTIRSTWLGFHVQKSHGKLFGYSDTRSGALCDDQNVKCVMNQFNTDRFELWLRLPKKQQNNENQ